MTFFEWVWFNFIIVINTIAGSNGSCHKGRKDYMWLVCYEQLTLACAHAQRRVIAVGLSVCVCVCACVLPSVRLSTVFLGNRGNSERETWTYYQVGGMHGKIRFWSGEGRGSW